MDAVSTQTPKVTELPREVSLALLSSTTFDFMEHLLEEAGVSDPDVAPLSAGTHQLVSGKLSPDAYLKKIVETYQVDQVKATSIAVSVGSSILHPFESQLPISLTSIMKQWGGSVVPDQKLDPQTYVKSYVASLAGIEDLHLRHRLEAIFSNMLTGATTREQSLEHLARSVKLDGLGLTEQNAQEVLSAFEQDTEGKEFALPQKKQETPPPTPTKKPIQIETDFSKEEEELDKINKEKASILERKGPLDVPAIVKEICENKTFQFEDPLLQERCQKLVESRVRDVRNAFETRSQLERPVEKGGLGVSGRRLADILQTLERSVRGYQEGIARSQAQERVQKKDSDVSKEAFAKKEEQILSKRYVELTGRVPSEHVAPVAPSVTRTSAAISTHHEQLAREGKIDTQKVRAAVDGAQSTVSPRKPLGKPSMQEVSFTKRLSGPIDELHTLSLTDFRRLSKDPMQAATKVKDKVDLMEEQGYEKKVEAVQAWRSSPMNQLYVQLTRQAVLEGSSVAELLNKQRAAQAQTFTDEELKAIMQLNADLRF